MDLSPVAMDVIARAKLREDARPHIERTTAEILRGSWRAIEWREHARTTVVCGNGCAPMVIAQCEHPSGYSADAELLARVIAATPDLLRAARAVLLHLQRQGMGSDPHLDELRMVIEKATGEA